MQEDLERITQRLLEDLGNLQRYAEKQLEEGLKGAFDPALLQSLFKGAGFDASVKKRYHERVRQFHPDTAGPGMEFHFQCTLAAYEMIKRERGWQ